MYVNASSKMSLHSVLHASITYRVPEIREEMKRRNGREGASKNANSDKRNVNDENGKLKKEDRAAEGKKMKVEKSGKEIKIISWNVAGLRAWIKVILFSLHKNSQK